METADKLLAQRRKIWRQDGTRNLVDPVDAASFLKEVGVCTHYAVSPEFPNLLHAYVGDPSYKAEASWDSPAGQIYPWRWEMGRASAGFYGALVKHKPTWVSWDLLPLVLGAMRDRRDPEDLYQAGELSQHAVRLADALRSAGGPMATAQLRATCGFSVGKENRAAYLKGLEELEARLWVCKVFVADQAEEADTESRMSHVWVGLHTPDAVEASERMSPEDATAKLGAELLARYRLFDPKVVARALRLSPDLLLRDLSLDRVGSYVVARPTEEGAAELRT
jgi:hypothetical protein